MNITFFDLVILLFNLKGLGNNFDQRLRILGELIFGGFLGEYSDTINSGLSDFQISSSGVFNKSLAEMGPSGSNS
jgi:hypothetical protein